MPKATKPRVFAFTVDVPEFDEKAAYNPSRPISGLIRTQLLHLHTVEQHLPEKDRTDVNINQLHTERQAGKYIQQVTQLLHKHGKRSKAKTTRLKKPKPAKIAKAKGKKRPGKKGSQPKTARKRK